MNKVKFAAALAVTAAGLSCTAMAQTSATLSADFTKPTTPVSKNLFGIFYEDINYAADGGLYGEMIQNRSFEFRNCGKNPVETWTNVNKDGKKAKLRVKAAKENPLNANNPIYAKLKIEQAGDGICNKGYDGMYLEKGKKYPGSIYLRSTDGSISSVTITVGETGSKNLCTVKISGITKEWKKFSYDVIAAETTKKGELCIYPDQVGELNVDFVSLFRADIYKNEENGLRADLAQKLEDMHPAFVRFPGGCIVHGLNLNNRYQWKDTIGPVEERKEKQNFWGYEQSYGIGFYEYFRLCEDIGAEPLPVLSVGMAHNGEISPSSDYQQYAQDALDLIEYATGSATSTWGSKRAAAGHPEPFQLHYIGIGNEDCGQDYLQRFEYIAKAVKAKYPQIKTIISSGYTYNDINFHNAWNQVKRWEKNPKTADLANLVDEHYYNPSSWFLSNGSRYDDTTVYPRGDGHAKVFIGEYASWVDGRKNNLYASLTEAAYMTSIERNGDVVEISSYAPLFARDGKTQWVPDMIWFNDETVYGSPNYYVQKMFMTHKSDETVKYTLTQGSSKETKNFIGGTVGIGTWSTTAQFKNIKVTDNKTGKVIYSSDDKKAKMDDFRQETGMWSKEGATIVQSSPDTNIRAILNNESAVQGVSDYTLELNAMKTGGAEGFLIMFGVKGKSLYWWNMGGWGNTQSVIEKGTAEGRSTIGDSKPMTLDTNRWYNIKIEVKGESYKCYLDGELIHEFTDVMNFDPLYAHVGQTKDGKVIVKIVNVTNEAQDVKIELNGISVAPEAVVTYMTGNAEDENSFADPEKVSPKEEKLSGVSSSFTYKAKANSVAIIEMKKN